MTVITTKRLSISQITFLNSFSHAISSLLNRPISSARTMSPCSLKLENPPFQQSFLSLSTPPYAVQFVLNKKLPSTIQFNLIIIWWVPSWCDKGNGLVPPLFMHISRTTSSCNTFIFLCTSCTVQCSSSKMQLLRQHEIHYNVIAKVRPLGGFNENFQLGYDVISIKPVQVEEVQTHSYFTGVWAVPQAMKYAQTKKKKEEVVMLRIDVYIKEKSS